MPRVLRHTGNYSPLLTLSTLVRPSCQHTYPGPIPVRPQASQAAAPIGQSCDAGHDPV